MRACQCRRAPLLRRRPPERCAWRQSVQDRNPRESDVCNATLCARALSSCPASGSSPPVHALREPKAMATHAVSLRRARRRERTMLPVKNDMLFEQHQSAP